jgi:hypothetical protein
VFSVPYVSIEGGTRTAGNGDHNLGSRSEMGRSVTQKRDRVVDMLEHLRADAEACSVGPSAFGSGQEIADLKASS